jgi:hypothetical protein
MKLFFTLKRFLFVSCCFILLVQPVFSQTDSVQYHDGTFESQYGAGGAYPTTDFYRYATRFTPPYYPANLVGIKAWFRNAANPSSFKFVVYKDTSGAAMGPVSSVPDYISPVEISNPSSTGALDSSYGYYGDISSENILITAGDVYAGVTQHPIQNGFVGITIDNTNAFTQDRPWAYYGAWTEMVNWAFVDGEWGITAYFTPVGIGMIEQGGHESSLFFYPNPTVNDAVITYSLERNSSVTLRIVDMIGHDVMQIVSNEKQEAGKHSAVAGIKNLSAGIYFVMIQTENSNSVIRFMKE